MSPNNVCPSCGAALEDNVGSACPYCGSALHVSAATIISAPAKKKRAAKSSAETMDEVKQLVREGDKAGAAEVAGEAFGLDQEAAQTTVEQVATDMKYSAPEPIIVEPIPNYKPSEPVSSSVFDEPKKPFNSRPWIIGCSIAAVVFLCLCCCLPILIAIASIARNR